MRSQALWRRKVLRAPRSAPLLGFGSSRRRTRGPATTRSRASSNGHEAQWASRLRIQVRNSEACRCINLIAKLGLGQEITGRTTTKILQVRNGLQFSLLGKRHCTPSLDRSTLVNHSRIWGHIHQNKSSDLLISFEHPQTSPKRLKNFLRWEIFWSHKWGLRPTRWFQTL